MKKTKSGPLWTPFAPHFGGKGSSATSPLEIWDTMPHYLKTLF